MRDKYLVRIGDKIIGVRLDSQTELTIGGAVSAKEEIMKLAAGWGSVLSVKQEGGRIRVKVRTSRAVRVIGEKVRNMRRLIS